MNTTNGMCIAHLKLTSFVPTNNGYEKRVGYVTLSCVRRNPESDWNVDQACDIAVSLCRPGEVFKKKHGVNAVTSRQKRYKSWAISVNKNDWVKKALDAMEYSCTSWVDQAIMMWKRDVSWEFAYGSKKMNTMTPFGVEVYPITFLNDVPLRK